MRVHENFRVVALGLPVPPFAGKPLDPPLRSRFQARLVPPVDAAAQLEAACAAAPSVPQHTLQTLVTFAESVKTVESSLLGGAQAGAASTAPFPEFLVPAIARQLETIATGNAEAVANGTLDLDAHLGPLLARAYPFLQPEVASRFPLPHQPAIDGLMHKLGLNAGLAASGGGRGLQQGSTMSVADVALATESNTDGLRSVTVSVQDSLGSSAASLRQFAAVGGASVFLFIFFIFSQVVLSVPECRLVAPLHAPNKNACTCMQVDWSRTCNRLSPRLWRRRALRVPWPT